MHVLKNSKSSLSREMAERLYGRRLYKRAIYAGQDQVNTVAFQTGWSLERSREVAEDIAGIAGCRAADVLVDIPPVPGDMSLEVQVKNRHALVGFAELSPGSRHSTRPGASSGGSECILSRSTVMRLPTQPQKSCT